MTKISIFHDEPCELGEGPGFDPLTNTVWWFDILAGRLFEKPLAGGEARMHSLGQMASALAVVDKERQLVLTETGLFVRDRSTGHTIMHQPIEADNPATRSNDARVHPAGAFWVSTMGKKAEPGAGAVYWYREGELRKLYGNISIANSICFAPDGRAAYFADLALNIVWRVNTDPGTGLPNGEPTEFLKNTGSGGFDGSVVDADGNLWNASWGGSRIDVFTPSGNRLRTIELPIPQPTCPAFIGTDSASLVVTSAYAEMDEASRLAYPDAGKTFRIEIAGKGRLDPQVRI